MDSILQDGKECYITGDTLGLHKHHCYFGNPNRKSSEKYGCWIWLRYDWHNGANYGVHFDHRLDMMIKEDCQKKFEETHTREEFRDIFGRSYL